MRNIVRRTACFLCIVLLLSGCSGGNSESANTVLSGGNQTPGAGSSESQQAAGNSQGQAQMIKPQQLISKEEAATLIGEAVKDAANEEYPMLGLNICFYAAEKSESKSYVQVAVIQQGALSSGGSGGSGQSGESSQPSESASQSNGGGSNEGSGSQMSPKTLYEGFKKMFSDPNAALTGRIGEDAFISAQGMSILSGEFYIYVVAGTVDPAQTQTLVKQAAELAVNNLKRIQGK